MAKQIKAIVGKVNLTCECCINCRLQPRCEKLDFVPLFEADDDNVYCINYEWNGEGKPFDH
jgi:hypothetical protein